MRYTLPMAFSNLYFHENCVEMVAYWLFNFWTNQTSPLQDKKEDMETWNKFRQQGNCYITFTQFYFVAINLRFCLYLLNWVLFPFWSNMSLHFIHHLFGLLALAAHTHCTFALGRLSHDESDYHPVINTAMGHQFDDSNILGNTGI